MDRDFEELKLLFDYTQWQSRFSLIVATVGAAAVGSSDYHLNVAQWPMWVAIILAILAAFSAGVVASSIPDFHQNIEKLWEKKLGPIRQFMVAKHWFWLQHGALYVALLFVLIGLILGGSNPTTTCRQRSW